MMLRSTVGAPRNTPKTALRVLVGVPPFHIVIKESAARTAARLRALGEWIPGQGRHAEIAELPCMELLNNDLDRTAGEIIFEKRFSIRITSRDEWVDGTHPELANTRVWYTDGSKLDGNTGSAAWGRKERALIGSAGPRASVFQSEILAIKMCVEKMLRQGTEGMRISICSDSVAALNALDSVLVSSKLVGECKNSLNTLGSRNKITL